MYYSQVRDHCAIRTQSVAKPGRSYHLSSYNGDRNKYRGLTSRQIHLLRRPRYPAICTHFHDGLVAIPADDKEVRRVRGRDGYRHSARSEDAG